MRRVQWLPFAADVYIRELKEAEADAVLEYLGDPDVVRFMDWVPSN